MSRYSLALLTMLYGKCPVYFISKGKKAFDSEIENPAFEGKPIVVITRLTEENDVVVAEGTVLGNKKGGEIFNAVFCDVFEMKKMLK